MWDSTSTPEQFDELVAQTESQGLQYLKVAATLTHGLWLIIWRVSVIGCLPRRKSNLAERNFHRKTYVLRKTDQVKRETEAKMC